METKYESIGKLEFESPINLEGSWRSRTLADKAKSKMELFFYKDNTGFIEWECEQLDLVENIGLTFELDRNGKRTLTDYDGVMTLPDQAMDLLERHNVDCAEMRKSLAD
jgi:hypothetical protein